MGPDAWKRRLTPENWDYLMKTPNGGSPEALLAGVLTRLYEIGWRGHEVPPRIDPAGTKVVWPGPGDNGIPVLTSEGLERFWDGKGHRFLLLRAPQACRAMAGPLAPRFQEFLAAYEEQCHADDVAPLPDYADLDVFVGGEGTNTRSPDLLPRLRRDPNG